MPMADPDTDKPIRTLAVPSVQDASAVSTSLAQYEVP